MKIGDLVRVKDCLGYNSYMQTLTGHSGILLEIGESVGYDGNQRTCKVFICGKVRGIWSGDLEVISESR
jgi:hypothetical protein